MNQWRLTSKTRNATRTRRTQDPRTHRRPFLLESSEAKNLQKRTVHQDALQQGIRSLSFTSTRPDSSAMHVWSRHQTDHSSPPSIRYQQRKVPAPNQAGFKHQATSGCTSSHSGLEREHPSATRASALDARARKSHPITAHRRSTNTVLPCHPPPRRKWENVPRWTCRMVRWRIKRAGTGSPWSQGASPLSVQLLVCPRYFMSSFSESAKRLPNSE